MIDPEQLRILRHALGIGDCGTKPPYRNHFVTGVDSSDHPHCMALVQRGLMSRRTGNALSGGDDVFSVTADGRLAAGGTWVKQPRSKQRYADWLREDGVESFGEWLRRRRYKDWESDRA
ncbi:hypothetical protein [Luteimonas fraxinea]|uniref:Uncharacterized protein n=1 Tax=Luteimonas fraxinea TaxID=2901869 RepID=A0ABS8UDY8_9GAMM|nr:hypothetical protein [Luteimonas fraxinea]MCD9097082.1 hypothetical protein [Luteimonas fraxinea]